VVVNGKTKATAKLNIIVNAITGFCPIMSWSGFRITEQKLAPDIMQIAKPNDLVIRDLGYFALPAFKQMIECGIYFLSRWENCVNLYDPVTIRRINLKSLLKGKSYVDTVLLCGQEETVTVRFVAIKLPVAVANERRRKAREHRYQKVNHNKLYYYLLGYSIYITNVEKEIWTCHQIAEAYATRWQVEILFKSWKSGFGINKLIPPDTRNDHRIESVLYLIVLYLTWFQIKVYEKVKVHCLKKELDISILRIAKWAVVNINNWLIEELSLQDKHKIIYYCSYDKRRRLNAGKRFSNVFDP
nr:transposase [Chitinophagales bacterium]